MDFASFVSDLEYRELVDQVIHPVPLPESTPEGSRESTLRSEIVELKRKISKLKNTSSKKANDVRHAKRQNLREKLNQKQYELSMITRGRENPSSKKEEK